MAVIFRSILGLAALMVVFWAAEAGAQDTVVARVNGKPVTEADMKLAEAEVGSDLGSLAGAQRRRVLVEFLIETQLMADAAEGQKINVPAQNANTPDARYWRRRALRDAYFDKVISGSVTEQEVRAFFDQHVGSRQPEEEVRARHILVASKEKARELYEKIAHGAEFGDLARQFSNDPGSKEQGGDLGFFVRGQMVPQFEDAAFSLKPGEVSQPFQTQFGWHIIKVDARRERQLPPYDAIKDRVRGAVIHRKAQQLVGELRNTAQVEYVDPEIRKEVEASRKGGAKGR